jgi:CelD/BcsL family acetyltransferase involved in cellulose biosynthesis/peptidoglycan/xylan/chitin deacetylase (PgdA/CDA1 family)
MRVEVVTTSAALAALTAEWGKLAANLKDGLFLEADWLLPWWRHYGEARDHSLFTLGVYDTHGALVGAAPFYRQGRTLRLIGTGGDTSPDYLGVLSAPGQEKCVANEIANELARISTEIWDAVDLSELPEDDIATWALERAIRRIEKTAIQRVEGAICPYVDLAATVDDHWARLPRKLRSNIARRRRRLSGAHFFRWDLERDVGAGIEQIAKLHRARFSVRGATHGFATARYLAFHTEVATRLHKIGRLRLYALAWKDAIVAMLYCFRRGDRIYHFQSGFDPRFASAGVGQLLIAWSLEQAIAEHVTRFDFLKGDYPYKRDWETGRHRTVRLIGARLTFRGAKYLFRNWLEPAVRSAVRSGIRPRFRRAGRRLFAELSYRSGMIGFGFRLLAAIDRRNHAVVVAYHKVLPRDLALGDHGLPCHRLREHLEVFTRCFRPVSADELIHEITKRPGARRRFPILLTFDDGHENAFRYAAPHLSLVDVPALFFVSVGNIGTSDLLWTDELAARIHACRASSLQLTFQKTLELHLTGDAARREALVHTLKKRMKRLPIDEFEAVLEVLRRQTPAPTPNETSRLASWEQVKQVASSTMTIGSHACRHLILSNLTDERLAQEIRESQKLIEVHLGSPTRFFAYPNGTSDDYDTRTLTALAENGFTHAFTMDSRIACTKDHPLLIPRVAPQDEPGSIVALELFKLLLRQVLRLREEKTWVRSPAPIRSSEEPPSPPSHGLAPAREAVR